MRVPRGTIAKRPRPRQGRRHCQGRTPHDTCSAPLGATWRSGDAADCKSAHPGSIPGVASSPRAFIRTRDPAWRGRRGGTTAQAPALQRPSRHWRAWHWPRAMGPRAMGPHAMGPRAMGPRAMDPHAMGLYASGPNPSGAHWKGAAPASGLRDVPRMPGDRHARCVRAPARKAARCPPGGQYGRRARPRERCPEFQTARDSPR